MVIYLDVLALVNLSMDYILLLATARIAGVFVPRLRLAAGAAAGSPLSPTNWMMSGVACDRLFEGRRL